MCSSCHQPRVRGLLDTAGLSIIGSLAQGSTEYNESVLSSYAAESDKMIFAFGPDETFFFDDGNGNLRWRTWPAFDRHMASKRFGRIQSVALGEGGTFWISYKNPEGLTHYNDWEDPHAKYAKLENWLLKDNIPHDYSTVILSLGANGSFFAASNQGHRWKGLPVSTADLKSVSPILSVLNSRLMRLLGVL